MCRGLTLLVIRTSVMQCILSVFELALVNFCLVLKKVDYKQVNIMENKLNKKLSRRFGQLICQHPTNTFCRHPYVAKHKRIRTKGAGVLAKSRNIVCKSYNG